jgi:hypothetical protein
MRGVEDDSGADLTNSLHPGLTQTAAEHRDPIAGILGASGKPFVDTVVAPSVAFCCSALGRYWHEADIQADPPHVCYQG